MQDREFWDEKSQHHGHANHLPTLKNQFEKNTPNLLDNKEKIKKNKYLQRCK